MSRRSWPLLLVIVLVAGGCAEDLALAQDFIKQWAVDHAVEIAKTQMGVPSGDPYVDAAVDAGTPILQLQEADADMAKGRAKQDAAAMDAALKIRPHDWTYEVSRANLALQQGDMNLYEKTFTGANHDYVPPQGSGDMPPAQRDLPFLSQEYSELTTIDLRLNRGAGSVTGYKSYSQCVALYQRLILILGSTVPIPGSTPSDLETWQARRQDCEQIAH